MAGLGIIASAVAFANLSSTKKAYESAKDQYDGIIGAINTLSDSADKYNEHKYDQYDLLETEQTIDTKPNDRPFDGTALAGAFKVTTILRVANLVGSKMKARTSVVLENTGDKSVQVAGITAECNVLSGVPVLIYSDRIIEDYGKDTKPEDVAVRQSKSYSNLIIEPGKIVELQLDGGLTSLGDRQGELRFLICEANGKKLITSCPKTNIDGGEKADIAITWCYAGDGHYKKAYWVGKPGLLRYCGEAGLKTRG